MKNCPTCNRTFEDTFTFCLADGSLLDAPFDSQATLVIPEPRQTEQPPTEVLKLEETKQEIPPTIASPQPQQKQEEPVDSIKADVPVVESPPFKALPVQSARKSKQFTLIIAVVAAMLVLAIAAVIYFGKREEYRIVDVRLFREGKSTTRFLPNDAIAVTVKALPVAKEGSLWVTKRLFFRGENQLIEIPDTDPAPPPLSLSSTSFPLSGASQPGSYLLEVTLTDDVNRTDSHAVWFEVIENTK